MASSKRASIPGICCVFPHERGWGRGALPFYLVGDGAVYGLSLVASQASFDSHLANSCPGKPKHGLAWRGGHSALAATLTRRKPRQNHGLHRPSLWAFPARRICHPDSSATAPTPRCSGLSTGHSSPFWAEPLILISKHQFLQPWG